MTTQNDVYKTVVFPVCGKCQKVLERHDDGIVVHGHLHLSGPVRSSQESPVIGSMPGLRNGGPSIHARCWACFAGEFNDAIRAKAGR